MYDDAPTRYNLGQIDYGAGADTISIILGPKGKSGLLWDYGCYGVTEAFAGGDSLPFIAVGTSIDPDHYGEEFAYGALAAGVIGAAGPGASIRTRYDPVSAGFVAQMVERVLPADTPIYVTHTPAAGAGLTGTAMAFVDICWQR